MASDIKVSFRDYDVYKLAITGPGQAGKTSLCKRLTENKFSKSYKPTVGADFHSYDIKTKKGKSVSLFYDFAGQDRFKDVRKVLYPGTDAAAIVFDVTQRESFREVSNYIRELKKYLKDIEITVVANKVDVQNRVISKEDAERIVTKLGCNYVETSAATGAGLGEFLKVIMRSAINARKKSAGR